MTRLKALKFKFADLEPLADRVAVVKDDPPDSYGMIAIPDAARDRIRQAETMATVIAIGPEVKVLRIGDRVLVSQYAGMQAKDEEGNVCDIMLEKDVVCRIRENLGTP